jgi:hypothetical protein
VNRPSRLLVALALPVALAACGAEPAPKPAPDAPAAPPVASLLLPADVPGTVPVLEAKKGTAGAAVAVVGRVRETMKDRAIFTLTDDSLDYCGRGDDPMDECPTPWDYCCIPNSKVAAASLVIELRGPDGRPVAVKDVGIRPLDLVAVKGTLKDDGHGGLYLEAADGWFRRERPPVPANVEFP